MKKKKIDIMLPVYCGNLSEITDSVEKQVKSFRKSLKKYNWKIVLSINGKKPEGVIVLAKKLHKKYPQVRYDYVRQGGKGSGVIHSWKKSKADIMTYMDVDLSTNIKDFPNLIKQVENGYDISIGSRYHPQSKIIRSFKRSFVSIGYHRIYAKIVLGAKAYTDSQCGFKAVNRKFVKKILPLVRNRNWFFESEMLYIAQRKDMKIKEIPIVWTESEFSGLTLYKAIWEFVKSSIALRFRKI